MDRTELLLEKYHDRLIIVEEKRSDIEVVKQLVDLKEWSMDILSPIQVEVIKYNIKMHPEYKEEAINLHLFTVVKNAKSRLYYEEMLALGHNMYLPFFDEPELMIVWDKTFGLQEVDSNLLSQDFKILKGVTHSDIEEKNLDLMNYLATIESWETSLEGLSLEKYTFQKIKEWRAK